MEAKLARVAAALGGNPQILDSLEAAPTTSVAPLVSSTQDKAATTSVAPKVSIGPEAESTTSMAPVVSTSPEAVVGSTVQDEAIRGNTANAEGQSQTGAESMNASDVASADAMPAGTAIAEFPVASTSITTTSAPKEMGDVEKEAAAVADASLADAERAVEATADDMHAQSSTPAVPGTALATVTSTTTIGAYDAVDRKLQEEDASIASLSADEDSVEGQALPTSTSTTTVTTAATTRVPQAPETALATVTTTTSTTGAYDAVDRKLQEEDAHIASLSADEDSSDGQALPTSTSTTTSTTTTVATTTTLQAQTTTAAYNSGDQKLPGEDAHFASLSADEDPSEGQALPTSTSTTTTATTTTALPTASGFNAVEAHLESTDAKIAALNKDDEDHEDDLGQFGAIDDRLKEEDERISAIDREDEGAGALVQKPRRRARRRIDLIQADEDDEDVSEDELEAAPRRVVVSMVQRARSAAAMEVPVIESRHLRRPRSAAAQQARDSALALEASIDADTRSAEDVLSRLRGSGRI